MEIEVWLVLHASSDKKIQDQACPFQEAVAMCYLLGRVLSFRCCEGYKMNQILPLPSGSIQSPLGCLYNKLCSSLSNRC